MFLVHIFIINFKMLKMRVFCEKKLKKWKKATVGVAGRLIWEPLPFNTQKSSLFSCRLF
uniref:Uncharacterized protein n=1 Tax=uncultured bacterium contig00046 TaxID=1181532 RepID=A0A806JY63_9BACT|nr:hypothetical protein [uncultured bacterium contig00046]